MFTGIVTAVGTVATARAHDGGRELVIASPYTELELGESVAVDGVCLTVERIEASCFQVHAVAATLDRTRLGMYAPGRRVNLERALRAGDRLGGHLVQGHVDGVGTVEAVTEVADELQVDIQLPADVATLTVERGSLTVDGVSLTVNALTGPGKARVVLVPFTLQHTTLAELRMGHAVHLEADIIGRYVQALLAARLGPP
ncbi:MAG TPA: riboflavin synthase [Gemmatimonadales bacterium]|jgi:riboflavin synthase|nr:riboflavin synthase [Gemmatimonadales bacterium]